MPRNEVRKPSKSRLSVLRSKQDNPEGAIADWGIVDAEILRNLIQTVGRIGGAVRFGYTRDGGAYSIGIYLDDDRETFYFKPSDDIDELLKQLIDQLEAV